MHAERCERQNERREMREGSGLVPAAEVCRLGRFESCEREAVFED